MADDYIIKVINRRERDQARHANTPNDERYISHQAALERWHEIQTVLGDVLHG